MALWSIFIFSAFKTAESLYSLLFKLSVSDSYYHSWHSPQIAFIYGIVFALVSIILGEFLQRFTAPERRPELKIRLIYLNTTLIVLFYIWGMYNFKMNGFIEGSRSPIFGTFMKPAVLYGNLLILLMFIFIFPGIKRLVTRLSPVLSGKYFAVFPAVMIILALGFESLVWSIDPNRRIHAAGVGRLQAEAGKPNVLLVIVDTMRSDLLGCYGDTTGLTPNIDKAAADGCIFRRHYTNCPWTSPSFASIYTSDSPYRWFLRRNLDGMTTHREGDFEYFAVNKISEYEKTLPYYFRNGGYGVITFQPNGCVDSDLNFHLFNHFYMNSYNHSQKQNLMLLVYQRLIDSLKEHRKVNLTGFLGIHRNLKSRHCAYGDRLTDYVINTMKTMRNRPFLIMVNYMDVHEYIRRTPELDYKAASKLHLPDLPPPIDDARNTDWQDYVFSMKYVDEQIGRLHRFLKESGLFENTVFIVTSDHGEQFLEHNRKSHGVTVYNEEILVPMIISYPPAISSGGEIDYLTCHQDLLPTLVNLCELEGEASAFNGVDIFKDSSNDRFIFSGYTLRTYDKAAVMHRDWKLIYDSYDGGYSFYNLGDDPAELNPLAMENYPVAVAMKDSLRMWMERNEGYQQELAKVLGKGTHGIAMDRSKLRAIGYIR